MHVTMVRSQTPGHSPPPPPPFLSLLPSPALLPPSLNPLPSSVEQLQLHGSAIHRAVIESAIESVRCVEEMAHLLLEVEVRGGVGQNEDLLDNRLRVQSALAEVCVIGRHFSPPEHRVTQLLCHLEDDVARCTACLREECAEVVLLLVECLEL